MSPVADSLMSGSKTSVSQPIIDYSRYVKRYISGQECGSTYCKELGCREHFHCLDCSGRVFVKKEEMIRHFKWHKKRDESLQHGFMRYSPTDDCSEKHPGRSCPHNRKQTHYHCIHENCDKVYISTSDVQMHANYHRKDSAIIQEGFQRFRATENCGTEYCQFAGQRTTHFHCRRTGCRYTFKNKADIGKEMTINVCMINRLRVLGRRYCQSKTFHVTHVERFGINILFWRMIYISTSFYSIYLFIILSSF